MDRREARVQAKKMYSFERPKFMMIKKVPEKKYNTEIIEVS